MTDFYANWWLWCLPLTNADGHSHELCLTPHDLCGREFGSSSQRKKLVSTREETSVKVRVGKSWNWRNHYCFIPRHIDIINKIHDQKVRSKEVMWNKPLIVGDGEHKFWQCLRRNLTMSPKKYISLTIGKRIICQILYPNCKKRAVETTDYWIRVRHFDFSGAEERCVNSTRCKDVIKAGGPDLLFLICAFSAVKDLSYYLNMAGLLDLNENQTAWLM